MKLLLSLFILTALAAATPEGVPIQYMDSRGRLPESTRITAEAGRGSYTRQVRVPGPGAVPLGDKVVLLVDSGVEEEIAASLSVFQSDLEADGYTVLVWVVDGGSASDIRADLQAEYALGSLKGAIAIGDIPAGWAENGFGQYPVDVYLMDMNGTWTDSDSDGLFDSYSNAAPEIWLGRLTPDFLTFGSPGDLLNAYFAKNHAYRTGVLSLPDRALAYEEAFTGLTYNLDLLYDDVTRKNDPVGTNADDFKQEMLEGYEWVHLISHSSPWGSSFHTGAPPEGAGTLYFFEVPPLDPHAIFYVLNCCSNGRWTETDNLANSYIWTDSYGLAALAQAKVDYTNDFQEYYQSLANGSNLGDAFRVWLAANMSLEDGAVLFGDPTLVPRMASSGAGLGGGGALPFQGTWLDYAITDDLHSQGGVEMYSDPSSGRVFAVSGTSNPVRANILATSYDGGSWTPPVIVCQHEYWDWHPTVGGDGQGKVWTAWQSMRDNQEGYDIYVSLWNGSAWGSATALTTGDPYDVFPALSGGNGTAWVVWQKWQGGSPDIMGRMWTGSAWTTEEAVAGSDYPERNPDVAWNGGDFGLVYQVRSSDQWAVAFRDAPDSGPFGAETILTPAGIPGRYPKIAGVPGGFAVVWLAMDGRVMFSSSASGSWSVPEAVSGSDVCARPSVTSDSDGRILVSWTSGGNSIRCNLWDGASWSGGQTAVTGDAVHQGAAAFGAQGDPWLVYGVRDEELHWNLHAAMPDPMHTGEPGGEAVFSVSVAGANPVGDAALFSVTAAGQVSVAVYDMAGRKVAGNLVQPGAFSLDCRGLASGVYLLRAECGNLVAGTRFVKL